MINRAILIGKIGAYGVKLTYNENSKPLLSFTLDVVETTTDRTFTTFVPIVCVGNQAEPLAEVLEPGDVVVIDGKLSYQRQRAKDSKLGVVCFAVQRLHAAELAEVQP